MSTAVLLLAGGSGTRMGPQATDKILLPLAGQPAFAHVVHSFAECGIPSHCVVVCRDTAQQQSLAAILSQRCPQLPAIFTTGGDTRRLSVQAGLAAVPDSVNWILVHDCARPAVRPESIRQLHQLLLRHGDACSLAHRLTDTVRSFPGDPTASAVSGQLLDRSTLWAMETPQAFPASVLRTAHARLTQEVTDDLAAVEMQGDRVRLLENPFPNPKLTCPADQPYLESILQTTTNRMRPSSPAPAPFRIGFGYDVHRFAEGRPLILGGVPFDHPRGLSGHSDADVVCHAAADALLGAAGLPDIGHYFPNTDPRWKDASSLLLLREATAQVHKAGFRPHNLDLTVIAEEPPIGPATDRMKETIAHAIGLAPHAVGLKATTHEGLGAMGRAEGIATHAVASLLPVSDP